MRCLKCNGELIDVELTGERPFWIHKDPINSTECGRPETGEAE